MPRIRLSEILHLFRRSPLKTKLAFAWYQEAQWQQLRDISDDVDRLEKTHSEWLKYAAPRYEKLLKEGVKVQKIVIDVPDLFAWCREMGRKVDAEGRTLYAIYRLQEMIDAERRPGTATRAILNPPR